MANSGKDFILSSDDLFGIALQGIEKSLTQPNILSFGEKEYPEQDRFFRSCAWGRFISGGNRGGKTDAIVIDAVWTATDKHPYRPRPESWGHGAVFLRFVVADVAVGITQTLVPKLQRWIPETELYGGSWQRAWDNNNYILTFANGSTIDFVTHGMLLLKQGGVPRHAIYFDEEPPNDVFIEAMMRLIDFNGFWCIAATPTRGITWTHDELWEPGQPGGQDSDGVYRGPGVEDDERIDTFVLSAAQNPFNQATDKKLSKYFIGMSKETRAIRESGDFVAKSGLVFPNFKPETHTIEHMEPNRSWAWYSSVDFGINNPTAWLWHAVSPNGDIYTFAEHYAAGMNVPEHAAIVKAREFAFGKEPELRTGDPHGDQRQGGNGMSYLSMYAEAGIYIGTEGIPRGPGAVQMRIEKMQQYLKVRPVGFLGLANRPKWVISQNCPWLIKELRRLQWGAYESEKKAYDSNKLETVKSKEDHAFDSAGYFATLMPDLRPDQTADSGKRETLDFGEMLQRAQEGELRLAEMEASRGGWRMEFEEDEDEAYA